MNIQFTWMLLFGGLAAGLSLTYLALRAGQRWRLYVNPNARSSHTVPTPSLGGLAFVLPVLGYLVWLGSAGSPTALALAGGGLLLAVVGFWDDLRELGAPLRLGVHLCAVALIVAIAVPHLPWPVLGMLGIALLWHVNLYNFMDGIDGLAAAQCLVFCVGAQIVGSTVPGWTGDVLWLLSGSVLGFLVFNWPPARLFMGDVGSGFLGLLIGALAILLWQQQALVLPAVVILLTGFWCDATYTLVVRFATGQAFTQAHRSHLYQKLAALRGHRWTTAIFLIYATFWLVPLAWLCTLFPESTLSSPNGTPFGWLCVGVAALPLLIAAVRYRAGLPESGLVTGGSPQASPAEADRVQRHD